MWQVILTFVPIMGGMVHSNKDGLIDFFAKFCPTLPTILQLSNVVVWPVVEWWPYVGEGALDVP